MISWTEFKKRFHKVGNSLNMMKDILDIFPKNTPAPVLLDKKLNIKLTSEFPYTLEDAWSDLFNPLIKIAKCNSGRFRETIKSTEEEDNGGFDYEKEVNEDLLYRIFQEFRQYIKADVNYAIQESVKNSLSIGKIAAAHKRFGSCRAAGRALGIDHKTVSKAMKVLGRESEMNVAQSGAFMKGKKFGPRKKFGRVAQWLRDNPEIKLPGKQVEIAKLIGVTPGTVMMYNKQLKAEMRAYIEELPDLREHSVILRKGKKNFNTSSLDSYTFETDGLFGRVDLLGFIKKKRVIISNVPVRALIKKFKEDS